MSKTCLYSPAAEHHHTFAGTHFPPPEDRRLEFTRPQMVTHPSTNRARCRATALIETNALPSHHQIMSLCWCTLLLNHHSVSNYTGKINLTQTALQAAHGYRAWTRVSRAIRAKLSAVSISSISCWCRNANILWRQHHDVLRNVDVTLTYRQITLHRSPFKTSLASTTNQFTRKI